MPVKHYIEDLFVDLYEILEKQNSIAYDDVTVLDNFYHTLISDTQLTEKQGNYVLRLISKYADHLRTIHPDIDLLLQAAEWKHKFRVIDLGKKISITNENHCLSLDFKFPYSFKDTFDQAINPSVSRWNNVLKITQVPFFSVNFSRVMEFVHEHGFIIEDGLIKLQAEYDEMHNQRDEIEPYSTNRDHEVVLINCSEDTQEYFDSHKKNRMLDDIYLAKQMGFPYKGIGIENDFQKFFINTKSVHEIDIDGLLRFSSYVNKELCIVLDKTADYFSVIKKIVETAGHNRIDRSLIKVCFRENNKVNPGFNQWIKTQNLGGPVASGKIFIFLNTPPKWYLREKINGSIFAVIDKARNLPVVSKNLLLSMPFAFVIEEKEKIESM